MSREPASATLPWESRGTRIAVLGDVLLDEYWEGGVSRISPEAPVPIHAVRAMTEHAGGAANAARNITCAGGRARLFGVLGDDEAAVRLQTILREAGVETDGLLTCSRRHTIRKTRITANHQQLLRLDWERLAPLRPEEEKELLASLSGEAFDGVLISDYGKGALPVSLLQAVFAWCQEKGVPSVVDPKGRDFSRYSGCDVITPNLAEARAALDQDEDEPAEVAEVARALQERFQLASVLITQGAQGMTYFPPTGRGSPTHRRAVAREVYDVSGAGDTVAAIFCIARAASMPIATAMDLATEAAGIVVAKHGTQPVYRAELRERLQATGAFPASSGKVKGLAELAAICQRRGNAKLVLTNGCFDLCHAGHVSYLEEARSAGDMLVVAVNSDASVRGLKGPTRPLVTLAHRMQVLAGLAAVDYVVAFDEPTPLAVVEALTPDVLIKGADWAPEQIVGGDWVIKHGGEVRTIPLLPGLSTTAIIERATTGGTAGDGAPL